jgi:hypothetical protein
MDLEYFQVKRGDSEYRGSESQDLRDDGEGIL